MPDLKEYVLWFVTGSQHLYGPETLEQVAAHSQQIAAGLDGDVRDPRPGRVQAGPDDPGRDPHAVPRGQCRRRLRRA